MTRYPNPFASFIGLIARAFATLDERDNGGWRRGSTIALPRSRARHRSRAPAPAAPQPGTTSAAVSAEQQANPVEEHEATLRR